MQQPSRPESCRPPRAARRLGAPLKRLASSRVVASLCLSIFFGTSFQAWSNPVVESFESGFGAWSPQAFLPVSDPTWEWSVTRSTDQASDGEWSLMMTASGVHDDGTVWVERSLELPAGEWEVRLDFDLWSPGDADIGTWEKVAFLDVFDPEEESHFTVLGLEDFGGWRTYSLVKTLSLPEPRILWFAFGLNIVFETTHTHFFDAATIRWTPSQSLESHAWSVIKALYR